MSFDIFKFCIYKIYYSLLLIKEFFLEAMEYIKKYLQYYIELFNYLHLFYNDSVLFFFILNIMVVNI